MTEKVVVGLSGGVDSAVSAWLLKQQGYDVIGIFMKNWEDDDDDKYCSTRQDWIDAASVADVIGIELDAVNFSHTYKERVFAVMLQELQVGRTPNPDILCNAEIKFTAFLDHAMSLGANKIATGHYAQVRQTAAGYELHKGVDASKDQSYFLHRLTQQQLSRALFPLGAFHKKQVRELAQQIGLPVANKRDSTGICFIGKRPFREFMQRYLATQPGAIVDLDNRYLAEHQGLSFYTLGQRHGLGIGGQSGSDHAPWFVVAKRIEDNTLVVAQGHKHPRLYSSWLTVQDMHWITPDADLVSRSDELTAKSRYRQEDANCNITKQPQQNLKMQFINKQWAVTPGQSAVLYYHSLCLGGGVISACEQSH